MQNEKCGGERERRVIIQMNNAYSRICKRFVSNGIVESLEEWHNGTVVE